MPNHDTHVSYGLCAGTAVSAWTAREEPLSLLAARAFGGALGGYVGAKMPDIFDPSSLGPNHRGLAHGVLPVGVASAYGAQHFLDFREQVLSYGAERDETMNILCNIAVGILEGLVAGYFSHLALDATTPRSLPIIC